jgi:ligand-binding sensor domain-containing protein
MIQSPKKTLSVTFLILITIIASSCNAQVNTKVSDETEAEPHQFIGPNAKLRKTLGTTEHQNVHCSLQDKAGNLWFGTTGEGVYRFDGKEFTQFTTEDGLSNNSVWSILEDKAGNIWFGTDDGVCLFDGKSITEMSLISAYPIGLGGATPPPGKNSVWSLMQDKSGIIWIGTTADLYCYDGKYFTRFLDKSNIVNNQDLKLKYIQSMLEDRNGTIWLGSGPIAGEGVIRFDGKSIESSKPNGDGWIRYIREDKRGNIWFSGRQNGVFRYDGQSFNNFSVKTNIGSAIFVDKAGNVWFDGGEKQGTIENESGIWSFDGKTFKNYTTKDGLLKNSVWSILEDNKGNIWIGTRNCGLSRFDGKSFVTFSE